MRVQQTVCLPESIHPNMEFPGFSGHVVAFFLRLQSPRD
jgi:hypothetical protein